jgi:hypothetical protein
MSCQAGKDGPLLEARSQFMASHGKHTTELHVGCIPSKTCVNMAIDCNKHISPVIRHKHIYKGGCTIASERSGSYHQQALLVDSIPSPIIGENVSFEQGS